MLLPKQYSLMLGGGHLIFVVVLVGLKVIERRAVEPPPHPKGNQND